MSKAIKGGDAINALSLPPCAEHGASGAVAIVITRGGRGLRMEMDVAEARRYARSLAEAIARASGGQN